MIREAWTQALANSSLKESDVDTVIFSGQNDRVKRQAAKIITTERFQDNVASNIGNAGTAEAGLLLLSALEHAHVGQKVALCSFNDGVEILIFEVESDNEGVNPIEHHIKNRSDLSYGKFLQWREMLPVQPVSYTHLTLPTNREV